VVPEQRKIDQVVVGDKVTADAIAKALQGGKATLADAAKAATSGKSQPVTLDFTSEDQFPQALRGPVFGAEKGAVVGPIESPLGFHIIRIVDVLPGHAVSFGDAKSKLIAQLKHDGAADRLAEQIDKLGDKLQGGAPMDQVAASVNATPVKVGPVDAKGNPAPGSPSAPADLKRAQPDPAWLAQAFQLGTGETSAFQDTKDGGYFAVRLDSVRPPALRPLADVRDDVVADWTQEQRTKLNAKRAEDLAAKARSGTPMTDIAGEAKSKMDTTPGVTRESATLQQAENGPSPALIDALFQLDKIGDVTTVAVPDGQIVARLIESHAADPQAPGVDLRPLARELDRALQEDQLAQYSAALRGEYKVKINPKAIEMVAGQ
jgi:peptidyl-prolyl cis-trans isomerase D